MTVSQQCSNGQACLISADSVQVYKGRRAHVAGGWQEMKECKMEHSNKSDVDGLYYGLYEDSCWDR